MLIRRGDKGTKVSEIKGYLIRLGYPLNDSGANKGVFGPSTEQYVGDFQDRHNLPETGEVDEATYIALKTFAEKAIATPPIPQNPAYAEAKKFEGQGEKNKGFVAYLSKYWAKAGLPGYKTIVGSAFAWCGLFILAMNTNVGQKAIMGAAGARNWAKYGVEIDYKKMGAPKGAVVHINHNGDCNSASSNHVAFLDGDCTAEDLARKGAMIGLFGGNQSDMVKRSIFPAADICEVRWPSEVAKPPKITKSVNCYGATSGKAESTR